MIDEESSERSRALLTKAANLADEDPDEPKAAREHNQENVDQELAESVLGVVAGHEMGLLRRLRGRVEFGWRLGRALVCNHARHPTLAHNLSV